MINGCREANSTTSGGPKSRGRCTARIKSFRSLIPVLQATLQLPDALPYDCRGGSLTFSVGPTLAFVLILQWANRTHHPDSGRPSDPSHLDAFHFDR